MNLNMMNQKKRITNYEVKYDEPEKVDYNGNEQLPATPND